MRVIARQSFPYANRTIQVGEHFETSAMDAHVLSILGKVEYAPDVEGLDLDTEEDLSVTQSILRPAPRRQRHRRRETTDEPVAE